jgi:L-cysteate sulfo-lyase
VPIPPVPRRLTLADWPTPLEPMDRLAQVLGVRRLLIKRDDRMGIGGGGNKVRKLEYLLAEAKASGATTVVTRGAVQSNHVRLTAACAARVGLPCEAVVHNPIGTDDEAYHHSGNPLLDSLFGATLHRTGSLEEADAAFIFVQAELMARGEQVYAIPMGGSVPMGAFGYYQCAQEILEQLGSVKREDVVVVVAAGTGGTQAGLVAGFLGTGVRVIGISVWLPKDEMAGTVADLATSVTKLAGAGATVPADDVMVLDEYIGPGYGYPTDEGVEAMRLVARSEGIVLDPVYTGKTMAGLIDLIKQKKFRDDDVPLFLHTGGSPGIFGYAKDISSRLGE